MSIPGIISGMLTPFSISARTQRRFILGQQGLWPGRRWRGKDGLAQALRQGSVVQIDPLQIVAHSHDIALYGRVLDYAPAQLDGLLYADRFGFDYGGTVFVHPMPELPYWRVVMERNARRGRWAAFSELHARVIAEVRAEIAARGPLAGRAFKGVSVGPGNYRGTRDTSLALYYLWFAGELMTWGRRRGERIYDLRERIAPPPYAQAASPQAAEDYFALHSFRKLGLVSAKDFRASFSGAIERRVEVDEAAQRLAGLLAAGRLVEVRAAGQSLPLYALAEELPRLEALEAGGVPLDWQPLETTTQEEMTVLAPLEIASARGRAKALFDFDYVWEVYKPLALRRWGYYTLPLLWGDRLVARFDSRLDRAAHCLRVLTFWLEPGIPPDPAFRSALQAGLRRFCSFLGVERVEGVIFED
jgi:uncharacterized protein